MIWQNKGHEFDDEASRLIEIFQNGEKVYIFGAGVLGKEIRSFLIPFQCFGGFIDNDPYKQGKDIEGASVISVLDYQTYKKKGILVIAADLKNIPAMCMQLEELGLKKSLHYFLWEEFQRKIFPILATYYYNISYVELAQISLTERCTLKCKKCAHACPSAFNRTIDLTLEEAYQSADSFFSKVDLVREFVLIGGEPFLYRKLAQVIDYIGSKYRKKMLQLSITTNGTIIPSDAVIKQCKKHDAVIRVSNYSLSIPQLKQKYDSLIQLLEEQNVAYILGKPELDWFDYGFEYRNREESEEELIHVFDECHTACREVRGSKFYFCVMARSVSDNMKLGVGKEDYLNLDELPVKEYKKILLEFNQGYSEKGYLDMCRHCNGADAPKYRIPSAEQIIDKIEGEKYD